MPGAVAPTQAEAVTEASQAKQLEMAGPDAVATAQAETVGDSKAKHATQHATAGAKTVPDAVVPAQAEAVTETSQTKQLERTGRGHQAAGPRASECHRNRARDLATRVLGSKFSLMAPLAA